MNLEELLKKIDIDSPKGFEYFENFAEIVESDEEIDEDVLYQLFSKTDTAAVADIINSYFEDMLEAMPDDSNDMFLLLENIKKSLMGLIRADEEQNGMIHFAEELYRFKEWYCKESQVTVSDLATGEDKILSVRDAITMARVEKLGNEEYRYDFDGALDYEIDDYIINLIDLSSDYDSYDDQDMYDDPYDDE